MTTVLPVSTHQQQESSHLLTSTGESCALKLLCKQEHLARALGRVSRAVLLQSTMPILKHIKLSCDHGRLCLAATNLEIGIQIWLDAQVEQGSVTTLPADLLTKMVSSLPSGDLTLTIPAGSQTLRIECAGARSHIRGVDPEQFPAIPQVESHQAVILEAIALKSAIEQVVFAAAADSSKPVWSGAKLVVLEGALTLVAADSFRLTERIVPLQRSEETPSIDILIPARSLSELVRVLPSSGTVQLAVTEARNQAMFRVDQAGERINFVSRLIDATYPAYRQILPASYATRVVTGTKALIAAIGRASLFATDTKKSVRVTCKQGTPYGSIIVDAADADTGDHVSSSFAEVNGQEQQIFFHAPYLSEALEHIPTPQVALELSGPGRPALLRPVGDIAYLSLMQTMASALTA